MAVDWLLFWLRAITWFGNTLAVCSILLVLIGVWYSFADVMRTRRRRRRSRVTLHPTANVVRLVPRSRPYDWAEREPAS